MATKKETTNKKTTPKKSVAPKKQATKAKNVTKVSEEQIEKPTTDVVEVVKTEVVNGDPSVLIPKEEKVTEEKVDKIEKKEEEIKKPKNNIAKKLNQYFNYFWNGQAIDY